MITEIEIKNFKCFEDFKANGFKRVNLIVGKNNVGKTALMEACWIYEQNKNSADEIEAFVNMFNSIDLMQIFRGIVVSEVHDVYAKNKKLSFALYLFNKFSGMLIKTNNNYVKLNYHIKGLDVEVEINNFKLNSSLTNSNSFENIFFNETKMPFIPSCQIDDQLMGDLYDNIKENRRRNQLNEYLNKFDPDILEFDIINLRPKVFLESRKQFEYIRELGNGLHRYITIISAILVSQDSCLFLDEIENGIHYTHLDRLWEIILTLSKELNCQVFATTHSKDCIESYYKVSKKMAYKNVSYVKMTRLESGKIHSSVNDYELLENSMEQNHEVRGW